jgi:GR25 family glycosyltransferase involved in LPS biosynthesis
MKLHVNVLTVLGVFLVLVAVAYFIRPTPPCIDDLWVINLDKDTERLAQFQEEAKVLGLPIQRWAATHGKKEDRDKAHSDGICTSMTKTENKEEHGTKTTITRTPGVFGCWLSHKRLLQHLATLNVSNSYGHLITEDDCEIPGDFMQKWAIVKQEIPSNWDFIYIGVDGKYGDKISPNVMRWRNDKPAGNWGTHAYLVRHGVIPHILKQLKFYNSPIDVQYYRMLGDLHIYIIDPPLVKQREGIPSSILTM